MLFWKMLLGFMFFTGYIFSDDEVCDPFQIENSFPDEYLYPFPYLTVNEESEKEVCAMYKLDYQVYKNVFFNRQTEIEVFDVITPLKGGTHLLIKAINLMTGLRFRGYCELFNTNTFFNNHYWNNFLSLFVKRKTKTLTIIRDPRDTLISHCFWYYAAEDNMPLQATNKSVWSNASIENKCKLLLSDPRFFGDSSNIGSQLDSLKFLIENKKDVCVVQFEKLVGSLGNGSYEAQKNELLQIATFLNLSLNNAQYDYIINNLFTTSATFREGKIGSWKTYFDEEIKVMFKETYGKYLLDFNYEIDNKW